jgi:hypothetical protein
MPSMPPSALIEEVRFAGDSPLEGDGFEPSVPRNILVSPRSLHSSFRVDAAGGAEARRARGRAAVRGPNLSRWPAERIGYRETEVRFAEDSPVEGGGFEPSVPRSRERKNRLPGARTNWGADVRAGDDVQDDRPVHAVGKVDRRGDYLRRTRDRRLHADLTDSPANTPRDAL